MPHWYLGPAEMSMAATRRLSIIQFQLCRAVARNMVAVPSGDGRHAVPTSSDEAATITAAGTRSIERNWKIIFLADQLTSAPAAVAWS